MAAENYGRITVRDAEEADVPTLIAIKGDGTAALHHDRLWEAQGPGLRYIVLVAHQDLIGFACLVSRRPASWSDADDTQHLPQLVDVQVKELHRGQGYGTKFMRALERIVAAAGHRHLYLSVDPLHNPRAYALYQRLGYQPLQSEPYRKHWAFTDSAGTTHSGEDWVVDMVKPLSV